MDKGIIQSWAPALSDTVTQSILVRAWFQTSGSWHISPRSSLKMKRQGNPIQLGSPLYVRSYYNSQMSAYPGIIVHLLGPDVIKCSCGEKKDLWGHSNLDLWPPNLITSSFCQRECLYQIWRSSLKMFPGCNVHQHQSLCLSPVMI